MDIKSVKNKDLDPVSIKSTQTSEVLDSKETQKQKEVSGKAYGVDYDVLLSDESKEKNAIFAKAFQIAKQTPDVREDKIADIKKRIAEGSYQVDSAKIADGIFKEAIRDHLAKESRESMFP